MPLSRRPFKWFGRQCPKKRILSSVISASEGVVRLQEITPFWRIYNHPAFDLEP
jgi:hypothetical protein